MEYTVSFSWMLKNKMLKMLRPSLCLFRVKGGMAK